LRSSSESEIDRPLLLGKRSLVYQNSTEVEEGQGGNLTVLSTGSKLGLNTPEKSNVETVSQLDEQMERTLAANAGWYQGERGGVLASVSEPPTFRNTAEGVTDYVAGTMMLTY
jgi:hypothetical protein